MTKLPHYFLADWDQTNGETMEAWAQRLADEGWEAWSGPGCWFNLNGQRVWRVSLRHRDDRPRQAGSRPSRRHGSVVQLELQG